jgi:arabinan endo-1,5-alpha-L-arabinosidase
MLHSVRARAAKYLSVLLLGFSLASALPASALFRDYDGKVYMSYGSFFGGIGLAEINQSTGKLASSVTHIYGGSHQDIEAPYITRDGDYYYLFVNRGSCYQGANSSYYVQVSRSNSIGEHQFTQG